MKIKDLQKHIIGEFEGNAKGPLLICLAGMHGNEPAGVKALETILHLLEREPLTNPGFHYKGKIIGILGNVQAYREKKRHLSKDLNRMWTLDNLQHIRSMRPDQLRYEELELKELTDLLASIIESYDTDTVIMLDLHTTSAKGGIFSIATDDIESVRIASELHAPVIMGMLQGIAGTTLHFFTKENLENHLFANGSNGVNGRLKTVTGVAFEAGQHDEHLSVNRCIAAIINCMRSIGSVRAEDVENRHDVLLQEYSKNLPKIAQLVKAHSIQPTDDFRMKPGYKNFQPVFRGEFLGEDRNGAIQSPEDGMILMPLYQPQGSDGFFLIKEVHLEF